MVHRVSPHVKGFEEALLSWTDQRFVSREQIRALAMFSLHLVNLLEAQGWAYYGQSHRQKGAMGCLVVKADHEGTPHVVFTNARTHTSCIVIFLRRLEAGALEWRPDKYRQ